MNVVFKSPQIIGNKSYRAGPGVVPDHLYANKKFKSLVKSGTIVVQPKSMNDQQIQANKDAANQAKSELARVLTEKMNAAIASGMTPVEVAEMMIAQAW